MDLETLRRSNTVQQSPPEIIDLDTYRLSGKRAISNVIDLSDEDDDNDIKILNFIPKTTHFGKRKRIKIGESSNSRDTPFVCEICTDTKTIKDAFYISGCSHAYCSDCVVMYIGSKLDDNITNIGCPVPGCSGVLEAVFCRSILTPEVFERWGKALCEALVDVSERFYCPFPDCSALLINDGKDAVGNIKCPHCNRMFCAECKVPWHNGMGCSEFKQLHADEMGKEYDMLVNLAKKKKWQRCPRCRIYIMKNRGCTHMTCRCGFQFCYKCGSGYIPGGCECEPPPVQQYQPIPSIGGTFPFTLGGYIPNMAQTQQHIPSMVAGAATGVLTGGNFYNRNSLDSYNPQHQIIFGGVSTGGTFPYGYPINSAQPQEQIYSRISGGISTGGTFPYGYPINSAQRQENTVNGVAYAVQPHERIYSRISGGVSTGGMSYPINSANGVTGYTVLLAQQQIPSTVSSTGTLPYGYNTYPIRGGVSTGATLSYPVIPDQRQENVPK